MYINHVPGHVLMIMYVSVSHINQVSVSSIYGQVQCLKIHFNAHAIFMHECNNTPNPSN